MPPSTPPIIDEPSTLTAEAEIFCAGCGYNLRGIKSANCPECGLPVDRNQSAVSRIPWVHRRRIGRIRAYCRTVWLATIQRKRLAEEIARPVSYVDAQRFRLVTLILAASPFVIAAIIAFVAGNPDQMSISKDAMRSLSGNGGPWPRWLDLAIPWDAGIMFAPTLPVAIAVTFVLITGVSSYWFHPRSLSVVRQNRAVALSYYACAPLAFVLLLTLCVLMSVGTVFAMRSLYTSGRGAIELVPLIFAIPGIALEALIPVSFWSSTLSLLRNTTHPSTRRLVAAGFLVPISWLLCIVLSFGVLPMIVGLVRLMILSRL